MQPDGLNTTVTARNAPVTIARNEYHYIRASVYRPFSRSGISKYDATTTCALQYGRLLGVRNFGTGVCFRTGHNGGLPEGAQA
jgi:hypothetical protein